MANLISIDEFRNVDLRVGEIIDIEPVKGSSKLLKLTVDFGEEKRQIVAGIAPYYQKDELLHKKVAFVYNLEPKLIKGEISEGMILAAQDEENLSLLFVDSKIKKGAKIT